MKLKFGVLGYGHITKKAMIPALKTSNYAKLEMIGSCTTKNREGFGTYEEVLLNKNIDAVYIALPIGLHEEWAIKAAKAGKHVLVEKSSTTSYESAKKMVDVCKKNDVRIMEGFMFKYHPQHQKVNKIIKEGVLGDLLSFNGTFGSPFWDEKSIRFDRKLGGGILNEALCYPISASMMIFDEIPESVFCKLQKYSKLDNVDIKADIIFNYSNGKTAHCSSSFGAAYLSTYSVWGVKSYLNLTRAYTVMPNTTTKIYLLNEKDEMDKIIINSVDQTELMVDMFCKTINNRLNCDLESELLNQARVMEAARLSDKEERLVKISEIK
ncbi:MAG: Gfo/Idh/MocA family oxidoreductase [Nanoarchaeota archaeon]|nr:Gfo/Idh/MocA family oxidoreductase [Nanoarchaeota archaeon]